MIKQYKSLKEGWRALSTCLICKKITEIIEVNIPGEYVNIKNHTKQNTLIIKSNYESVINTTTGKITFKQSEEIKTLLFEHYIDDGRAEHTYTAKLKFTSNNKNEVKNINCELIAFNFSYKYKKYNIYQISSKEMRVDIYCLRGSVPQTSTFQIPPFAFTNKKNFVERLDKLKNIL